MRDEPTGSPSQEISVDERIRGHLLRDLSLADVLSRGLVNMGRTARWLERSNGWEVGVGEIVRALRSYMEEAPAAPPWRHGQHLLDETDVTFETGLALLTVSRNVDVRERLEDAWIRLAGLRRASIVDYSKRLQLILDDHAVEEVREILPAGCLRGEHRRACSIRLKLPDEPGAAVVPGCVVPGFLNMGIQVLNVVTAGRRSRILVPGDRSRSAFRVALMMTDPPEDWPRGVKCPPLEQER